MTELYNNPCYECSINCCIKMGLFLSKEDILPGVAEEVLQDHPQQVDISVYHYPFHDPEINPTGGLGLRPSRRHLC